MSSILQQITSDINLVKKKLHVVGKMPARYIIGLGVLGIVTVGMLVGLVASRQTTDDRSQAAEGGTIFYLTKPIDVQGQTQNVTAWQLQPEEGQLVPRNFLPVTDVRVMATAGRPVTSFSFVAQLRNGNGEILQPAQADALWEQFDFTFNDKINAENRIEEKLYPNSAAPNLFGAKLFAGTIGQQTATTANTITAGLLGSFTFTPVENQPDVRLYLISVQDRPEANSVYQMGSLIGSADGEERITPENLIGPFYFRNMYYVNPLSLTQTPTPTPTPPQMGDIGQVLIRRMVGTQWQPLPEQSDYFSTITAAEPQYLRTEISSANVLAPNWWRETTSVGFRMRVKKPDGTYRNIIAPENAPIQNLNDKELVQWWPEGSFDSGQGKLFAKWKLVKNGNVLYIEIPTTLINNSPNPANPGQRLLFEPGDSLEIRANVHVQNYTPLNVPAPGWSFTCKVGGQPPEFAEGTIIEAPIGNPVSQRIAGPCRNNSAFSVLWGTPDPTVTPTPTVSVTPTVTLTPTLTPTPTESPTAFNCDSYTSLRRSECESLVSLYTKTAGDQWSNTLADDKTWLNTDTDYCQWYGITCTPSPSFRVWRISLANNNLTGSMLSQVIFSGLTELRFLDLNGNQLGGQIPQNLSTLTKLTSLLLGNNNFSGTIPTFFASMNLFTISLENNQLTGSVPAELFKSAGTTVVGLQSIHLDRNSLRGELAIRSTDATRATALKVLLFHNQLNAQNARDNNQLCVSADGRAALEIIQARMGSNVNPAPPIPPVCPT